ncbi:MAG TPA: hypothetical protein VI386_15405 [Candidatus Sulfotelmatobacter sp.]
MDFLRRSLLKLLIFSFCVISPQYGQDASKDIQVVGITGTWTLADKTKLSFGQALNPNSTVVGTSERGIPDITIAIKGTPVRFACDARSSPACQVNGKQCTCLIPTNPPDAPSTLSLLATAIGEMFSNSERYITPVSRGLEPHLLDSVLVLDGQTVDFSPAFAEMDSGTYKIRIEQIAQNDAGHDLQVEWAAKGPAKTLVTGLQPGLCLLVRLNAQGQPAEPGGAWALLDPPDRFNKDSASFHAAEEETKTWPDDVDSRVPRAVLRAFLDSLAKSLRH